MSWSDQHEQVERDMENSMRIDMLNNIVRDKIMKRYMRKAGKLGLSRYSFTVLASSAAIVGLVKALKVLPKWDPEKREFAYFVFLKAQRVAVRDLARIESKAKTDALETAQSLQPEQEEAVAARSNVSDALESEELRSLLQTLKPEHSQILKLRAYGYSISELAAQLKRSEESTKSLLRRAKDAAARARDRQIAPPPHRTRDGPPVGTSHIISLEEHRRQRGARP